MTEPGTAALRFRNIAAYWRGRAARSQNAEARRRLHATALHYEELARGARPRARPADFVFSYAPAHRLIRIAAGKILTEAIYLSAYDAVVRFIAARGLCSLIVDLSAVEEFDLSAKFAFTIATRKPAVPKGMARFVVAPQPQVYAICHLVERLRSSSAAPITVVRRTGPAFAHFGVSEADFSAVEDAVPIDS